MEDDKQVIVKRNFTMLRINTLLRILIVYGKGWGVSQRFDELSTMLIKRFEVGVVEVCGQKENLVGLFEIFFNGQCVYSKVTVIVLKHLELQSTKYVSS